MKKILIVTSVFFAWTARAQAGIGCTPSTCTNPAHLYQKVYEVMVSTSADCTGLFPIFKNNSPTPLDWTTNPVIGAGVVPNGTYNCIAAKTDDIQTYVPAADEGAGCVAGTTYTWDIFPTGAQSVAPDGSTINGRGDNSNPPTSQVEDDPWSYMSINGSVNNTGSAPSSPYPLGSAWVVNGDVTHQIVVDFDGTIGTSTQYVTPYCAPIIPGSVFVR
jgi:hypothetical protein